MASATDFVNRISQIEGIAGCLLVKDHGALLGKTIDDPEVYTTLLQVSSALSGEIMGHVGFSYCRHICFSRLNMQNFYVFPIDKYLLGVVQQPDCSISAMLERVYQLIGRVSTREAESIS